MAILKTLTVNGVTYSVASLIPVSNVVLRASAWEGSNDAYYQVVEVAGVTSHTKVDLQPTPEQVEIFHTKTLAFTAVNNAGRVTVHSIGSKPQNDYTIQASLTEVEGSGVIRGNTVGVPNPQPDWNQDDSTKANYIRNKPSSLNGKTPEKGVDYYTEADKAEMVQLVIEALPEAEGGSY